MVRVPIPTGVTYRSVVPSRFFSMGPIITQVDVVGRRMLKYHDRYLRADRYFESVVETVRIIFYNLRRYRDVESKDQASEVHRYRRIPVDFFRVLPEGRVSSEGCGPERISV